jgi:chromosome partitioning protein
LQAGPNRITELVDIEDANVLIQNSLWLNVPLGDLDRYEQVVSLRDRKKWADNQVEQIKLLKNKFAEAANNIIKLCV